jgi:aminoglycoside phosphotransferase (APT) family kinase protein
MKEADVAKQFEAYVAHRMPEASRIEINSVLPIVSGASRQTFSMQLNVQTEVTKTSRHVILRREFESGIIDTKTRTEWEAYRAFAKTDVPVPEQIWFEEDPKWMGSPFLVMEEVLDCQASFLLFSAPPYDVVREKIGERFCNIMGTIPRTDPASVGLEGKLEKPAADECWTRELDYWEADIDKNQLEPHPVLRAAIRWLRRNPPPSAEEVVIVHGDMRPGNFLYNEAGEIKAMLDWEMMHMGDPLEDLAWALNRLWSWSEPDRLGLMLPREHAIQSWEDVSGFTANPDALFWWEVFASVKGLAIWASMNKVYATGGNTDALIGFGGMWAWDIQSRILIDQMRERNYGIAE